MNGSAWGAEECSNACIFTHSAAPARRLLPGFPPTHAAGIAQRSVTLWMTRERSAPVPWERCSVLLEQFYPSHLTRNKLFFILNTQNDPFPWIKCPQDFNFGPWKRLMTGCRRRVTERCRDECVYGGCCSLLCLAGLCPTACSDYTDERICLVKAPADC